MANGKQAKTLSSKQVDVALAYLDTTRYPLRNKVVFLLSIKAGLRAKEIASLRWTMVVTPEGQVGDAIHLTDVATKGQSGRIVPMNKELRRNLQLLLANTRHVDVHADHVITTERGKQSSAQVVVNTFSKWYRDLGFVGCSSHSGRRTFITNAARKISTVGGSVRDVQALAGHSNLQTTQRYIDVDTECQRRVVDLV